jgi:hypothetical protein
MTMVLILLVALLAALAVWCIHGALTDGPAPTDDERTHRARAPRSRDAHVHDGGRRARREHARRFRADVERFARDLGAHRIERP